MIKKIPLGGKAGEGKYAIVDKEDYAELRKFNWHITGAGYAAYSRKVNGKTVVHLMHREILGNLAAEHTDHINRDRLDNRKENLKPCTASENAANNRVRSDSSTGHKGIYWMKKKNLYRATTTKNGVIHYIGKFKKLDDAVFAHRIKFKEIHGIEP